MEIDFDLASKEWRKNKVSLGGGQFAYKCQYVHHNGKSCTKPVYSSRMSWTITSDANLIHKDVYCKRHLHRSKVPYLPLLPNRDAPLTSVPTETYDSLSGQTPQSREAHTQNGAYWPDDIRCRSAEAQWLTYETS